MSAERIDSTCPNCNARLRLPATAAGRRVRCPKCQQAFAVPAALEPEPVAIGAGLADDALAGLAAGTSLESADQQRARMQAAAAPPKPVRVRETKPARSAGPRDRGALAMFVVNFFFAFVPFRWAGRLNLVLLAAGIALFLFAQRASAVRSHSQREPQRLTLQQLIDRGPGDNLHILLTDFLMLPDYIYETKLGQWSGAWVPVVPPGAPG